MRTNICLAFMALFALVPFTGANAQYSLTVEASAPADATTPESRLYRFYVNANDATDKLSAVFGNDEAHLVINTPDWHLQFSAFNTGLERGGYQPSSFCRLSRSLADDRLRDHRPRRSCGDCLRIAGAADPSLRGGCSVGPRPSAGTSPWWRDRSRRQYVDWRLLVRGEHGRQRFAGRRASAG